MGVGTMQIDFLGCSGGIEAGVWQSTCYRVDRTLLIDCGTGAANMTLEGMRRIEQILITHAHLDHIACLPLVIDAVADQRERIPIVWAKDEVLAALRAHVFNDVIWPEITQGSTDALLSPTPSSRCFMAGDHAVEVLPAQHGIPACGYLVRASGVSVAFSGDTGPCPAFWETLEGVRDLAAVVVECSYPNSEAPVASLSQHMHVGALVDSVQRLPQSASVVVVHRKPGRQSLIESELKNALSGWTLLFPLGGETLIF